MQLSIPIAPRFYTPSTSFITPLSLSISPSPIFPCTLKGLQWLGLWMASLPPAKQHLKEFTITRHFWRHRTFKIYINCQYKRNTSTRNYHKKKLKSNNIKGNIYIICFHESIISLPLSQWLNVPLILPIPTNAICTQLYAFSPPPTPPPLPYPLNGQSRGNKRYNIEFRLEFELGLPRWELSFTTTNLVIPVMSS